MKHSKLFFLFAVTALLGACKPQTKKQEPVSFLSAKEAVLLNQLIYKENITAAFEQHAPDYEVVFIPQAVNGNYAIIAKNKATEQYALVVRGSVMEFSNEGFQNFILQDFNIFKIKPWNYTDTVQGAYISNGAWIGFQNLLQLRDVKTGLTIKEFIERNIPAGASIVITGHSLGGNLACPLAGYLKEELPAGKKENLQLITFGAPAAGNAAFVQDMEEKFPGGERYAGETDIAPAFPDLQQIGMIAKLTGLDSVLQLSRLNISKDLNAENILNIAGKLLEKTNILNKDSKYVQSQKHLRLLKNKNSSSPNGVLSADAIFGRAYEFHKVDMYAELLGGKALD